MSGLALIIIVPAGWSVVVLADRGLYAKWLFMGIRRLGWHPLLRITGGGKFRPKGGRQYVPLTSLAPCPGRRWCGRGTAFTTVEARLRCTLWAFWGQGHTEPWLLLTDLAPQLSDPSWYGLRSWIEQFFKDSKQRFGLAAVQVGTPAASTGCSWRSPWRWLGLRSWLSPKSPPCRLAGARMSPSFAARVSSVSPSPCSMSARRFPPPAYPPEVGMREGCYLLAQCWTRAL